MTRLQKIIGMTTSSAIFVVAVIALIVTPALGGSNTPTGSNIAAAKTDPPGKDFTITGQVLDAQGNPAQLIPGVNRVLRLTVNNTNNQDISVQTLTVTAANATGPKIPSKGTCPSTMLTVGSFTGPLFVGKNSTANYDFTIQMKSTASDACQGATFPLTFGANAGKA